MFKAEVKAEKEITLQQLKSLILSLDQNGHVILNRSDMTVLVMAFELLSLKFEG